MIPSNFSYHKANPKHIVSYKGENVYFCCDGCKTTFEKNPSAYFPEKK